MKPACKRRRRWCTREDLIKHGWPNTDHRGAAQAGLWFARLIWSDLVPYRNLIRVEVLVDRDMPAGERDELLAASDAVYTLRVPDQVTAPAIEYVPAHDIDHR